MTVSKHIDLSDPSVPAGDIGGSAELEQWVFGTYDRMRVLPNDGLCGVTLALIVLGILVENIFFVGAAVGAGMLGFRIGRYLLITRFEDARHTRRRGLEETLRAKERIWSNQILPPEQKELLSAAEDRCSLKGFRRRTGAT
jgi:hypothetical protein